MDRMLNKPIMDMEGLKSTEIKTLGNDTNENEKGKSTEADNTKSKVSASAKRRSKWSRGKK